MTIKPGDEWIASHFDASLRSNAQSAVAAAIKNGSLTPKPCELCGVVVTVAHHEDYRDQLGVQWLCKSHHALRHVELAKLKRPYDLQHHWIVAQGNVDYAKSKVEEAEKSLVSYINYRDGLIEDILAANPHMTIADLMY